MLMEDLDFEEDEMGVETAMWNPFHFAVYFGHVDLVRFFVEEMKINIKVTLPKATAESEKDPSNNVNFAEDKIMVLLIALVHRDGPMLEYLLNSLASSFSISILDHLLDLDRIAVSNNKKEPWIEGIQIVLRSKPIHTFYLNLSFKKRRAWVSKFSLDVTTRRSMLKNPYS